MGRGALPGLLCWNSIFHRGYFGAELVNYSWVFSILFE
jgi:hypothetical protein